MDNYGKSNHESSTNSDGVHTNSIISATNSERYRIEKRLEKSRRIAWIICLSSFLLILVSVFMMSMSWYPDRVLQGWPMVISILVCLCSLIVAINQSINYAKFKRITSMDLREGGLQPEPKYTKNSSVNSVVSLICALIPISLYFYYSIFVLSKPRSNTDQSGWIIVIYYWTIGFWLIPVWLICGVLGLKSKKRKMAIISLVVKPIGIAIFALLMLIASSR
ncbi:hypothetical protein IKF12_03090 [Candidatus Saccharibacteria bacterium]|nr:hypothetical protein [Candidatus Saccharibacteria bacterium]